MNLIDRTICKLCLVTCMLMCMLLITSLTGCSRKSGEAAAGASAPGTGGVTDILEEKGNGASIEGSAVSVNFASLTKTGTLSLSYAEQFSIDEYGDYRLINICSEGSFLLVPEGKPVPAGVPENVTVLQQPFNSTYLVASAVMDLLCKNGSLSDVKFSGTKARDWSIQEAATAMNEGSLVYAGKYSAPDYEKLVSGGCNLAIESTMIYHKPEVKEKLLELGIPVFVDYSTYESHPMGRLEWIKVYGVLFGKEKEASAYYQSQIEALEPVLAETPCGKSVAFFYVNTNGIVNVRKPDDYVVRMITLAGGRYALEDLFVEEDNALSTVNMQMEDFYVSCVDADILIYNGTIDTAFSSIDDLFDKSPLFKDFKAVREGNVFFASKDFYQQTTGVADFIRDVRGILDGREQGFTYITKL